MPDPSDCGRLLRIEGFADLWADACLQNDEGDLAFLSFYGRDASAMQFISALELGKHDGGITDFHLVSAAGHRQHVYAGAVDRLGKHTGRLPRQNVFGPLSHLWIYDKRLQEIDKVNRIAWIVDQAQDRHAFEQRTWDMVKTLCPVALLDTWRTPLMDWCQAQGAISELGQGRYPRIGDVRAVRVSISDHFLRFVSQLVREHVLQA
ncbi:hypothetical protein ABE607_17525 [Comamonas aquatica]|jgi:hypothetical protein|uniref:Uncharacterized protein n=1 Tax=Comamonas aquatica TaxID=225991 RepID=A0AA42HUF0_9BURK|nr:hypothetical protein [Comamonas aquatica]MDH0364690.1 hypothetical protein [Comamonas aquatica]WBM40492.1 hypothetical protein M2J84_09840 [Comamonas aquatica]CAB5695463.1 Uncharacterised protein [Comamonas aquatica]CAC9684880.1 Uncharacterised protein [Comamonas aquatica]